MYKKKFSEEQQGLVALLPQGLPKLTDGAKLVLANIILWYGTEQAKKDGFIYRSNLDMMKDCEIGSQSTLNKSICELQLKELLTTERGKKGDRTKASEYRLTNQILDKINFKSEGVQEMSQGVQEMSQGVQENDIINQLVEQNNYLILRVNELSKKIDMLCSKAEILQDNSRCTRNESRCTTDTESDTEKEKEKNKRNMVHVAHETTGEDELISTEVDKASAHKASFSFNFEKDLASAHGASAHKPISTEANETLSADETTHDSKLISAVETKPISDDTSTEEVLSGEADVISTSSKDNLTVANRLTNPQCLNNALTPNSAVPLSHEDNQEPNPQVEDFINRVKTTIRKAVYDWSLKLVEMPDYLTGDDINGIVAPALRQQPDVNDYLGEFRLSVLNEYAQDLMENRLKNKDIPTIIRQNRFEKKHSKTRSNEDDVNEVEIGEAPDKQINQNSTAEPSTKNDDVVDEDLPF